MTATCMQDMKQLAEKQDSINTSQCNFNAETLRKVEKLFKAAITPDVDIDAWNLATEQFVQHSTSAQEYAYTASFGEYNPSGGKDQVAKYMDLSRDELVLARDALRDVLKQIGGL